MRSIGIWFVRECVLVFYAEHNNKIERGLGTWRLIRDWSWLSTLREWHVYSKLHRLSRSVCAITITNEWDSERARVCIWLIEMDWVRLCPEGVRWGVSCTSGMDLVCTQLMKGGKGRVRVATVFVCSIWSVIIFSCGVLRHPDYRLIVKISTLQGNDKALRVSSEGWNQIMVSWMNQKQDKWARGILRSHLS